MSPQRLILLLASLVIGSPTTLAESRLPVFDAHIHYNGDARDAITPEAVLRILDSAGIRRALVSSTPNDGTLLLHEKYPERIVPALRPYRSDADRRSWFGDPAILALIEREVKRGIYRAIGEFHLHAGEANSDVIRQIVALAVQHDLVLHAHSDEAAITTLFKINPKANILWAHAGMSAEPDMIKAMLERYPHLSVELSLRNNDVAPGGRLDASWRDLLLKYPARILLGTDTWNPERWNDVTIEIDMSRRWLNELPRDVAEKIAHDSAKNLFGR